MRALRVFDLDARGTDHIRKRLVALSEWGHPERAWCAALGEMMESAKGRTWTVAPPETSSDQLYQFGRGELLPENLDMSRAFHVGGGKVLAVESLRDEQLAPFVELLRAQSGRAGIIADPCVARRDSDLSAYARTLAYAGDRVFHVVNAASDVESIDLALSAAPFWANLWVVTSAAPKLSADGEISEEDLVRGAGAALAMGCGAYDGEGFVVWQREA